MCECAHVCVFHYWNRFITSLWIAIWSYHLITNLLSLLWLAIYEALEETQSRTPGEMHLCPPHTWDLIVETGKCWHNDGRRKNISLRGEVKSNYYESIEAQVVKWLDQSHTASQWELKAQQLLPYTTPECQTDSTSIFQQPQYRIIPSYRVSSLPVDPSLTESVARTVNWKLVGLDSAGKFGKSFISVSISVSSKWGNKIEANNPSCGEEN